MLRTLRLLAYVCLPLVTLLPALLWANTAYGGGRTILYVDVNATGGGGSSWADAYKTLQEALDWTYANGAADFEIWVAEGVYYPDEGGSHVANSPDEWFRISYDNVQLYGGFAATETLRTQRIPSVHLTILSGDIDHESDTGKDINNDGNFIAETSADIQGSNAYHVVYLDGQTNEPLTTATVFDGFIVTGGSAYGSGWEAHGGGLYCAAMSESKGCSPTIANITFSGNMASRYGGGMYNWGYDGTSSPALTNVTFTGNQAVNGGGMYNSGEGGGVSSPSLTNVTFSGNQAGDGGGMSNYGYGGTSSPVLTNVTFSGNQANAGGGGMFNWGYYGTSSPVLTNVTFSGNRADLGGGVYNWADERGGTSSPALTNVIMWGDSAPIGAEIYNTGATPAIAYSDIDQDGFTGTGNNIRLNPQFVAPVDASSAPTSTGNYRLRLGSPAIDAGTNTGCPATDLDGTTRPWDGNGDGSAICDIGAYETHPLFVDKDATSGANNGSSWASAYTTLQDALDWTNAHGSAPFEIWVAEGVYYPDLRTGQNTNLQSDSFRVSYDNVQLYGGFAATETLRTQRMPSVHLTILSGDIDGNDINTYGNKVAETSADIVGSNAYHVLYFDGVTNEAISAATVLDGFIVTGGSASGGDSDANGGGLYCVGSDVGKSCSPTVAHITFSGNIADSSGGGMYNDGANGISSPVLTNVTFTGNRAGSGGGMYNYAYISGISSPVLTNVTFTGNRAGSGGGMFNWGTYGVSSPSLTNVTFTGNQSSYDAGGMINWGYNGISSPVLTNVTFSGNQAGTGGGGMYNGSDSGGTSSPALTNVTFSGNQAGTGGGGVYNYAGNSGTSSPALTNVIMWGDSAYEGSELYNYGNAMPAITYSDIDQDGIAGTGNFRLNPKFVAPIAASSAPTSTGNYHILSGSPAVDAGTNTGCPATDLDGLTRPWDGNGDGNAICDMGAYEAQLLFVDRDATGATHDGGSWATAYKTLQAALDWTNAHGTAAFPIWVAEGVYYPDEGGTHVANSPGESFRISYDNVQIYGGFAATETLRTQRNPAAHATILSGDIDADNSGNDTNTDGNFIAETSADIQGSNAYHVLYLDGETNEPLTTDTVIDGFIVTAGAAGGSNADSYGGGLYCGAIGVGTGCSPTIAHVTFSGNQAGFAGGGMCNTGFYGGVSSPVLTNVTFSGNQAASTGGGMYNHSDSGGVSSPVLANVTFSGNKAYTGGGMTDYSYAGTSSPVLINVTFSGNQANSGGGMLSFVQSNGISSPQLVNVIMWGDDATTFAEIGGGTPAISYSDIDQDGIVGTGNFRRDPLLSSLGDHGGGMLTLALLPGSPAIDTGDSVACAAAPVNNLDQRGVSRPQGGGCDIGAFESRGFILMAAGGSPQETTIFSPFSIPLAVFAGSADAEPLGPGGVITLTPPAEGPGLTVTAPFTVTTDAAGLTAGTVVTANGVVGSFNVTATTAGAAFPTVLSLANTMLQPTVALAISPNPAPYGAALTLTATVTTTLGAVLDPLTGSVTFTDTTNAVNLSSILAGGYAVVGTNPPAAGIYTVTAGYGGDAAHLPGAATAVVQVLPPPSAPQARADVAAVLQDTPLLIDVLDNDVAGTSQQMTVYTVTQPLAAGLTAIERNQVRFIPGAGFTGIVTFTSTIQDGNGLKSTAPATVRVTAANTTNGTPQVVSVPGPSRSGGGIVTVPVGTTEIEVPAGALTPTEDPLVTYDLVYQELNTPEPPPPGTIFVFGGRAFVLQLFINAELQPSYVFNVPIFVTISYDPADVPDTSRLALYYYDEGRQEWADDGIVILSIDTQAHRFRASIAHLTEFAAGITVPTELDPNLEPQILPQLFLPQVYH